MTLFTPPAPLVTPMLAPASSLPPMVMVSPPARYTLLTSSSLPLFPVFPVTVGSPDTVKVPPFTNTPLAVLPVMLALPFMLNLPTTDAYTPPPFVALLPLTLALPFMVKVPSFTYTPPP